MSAEKAHKELSLIEVVENPEASVDFESLLGLFTAEELMRHLRDLEDWRAKQDDRYKRVRACALLAGLIRFRLQEDADVAHGPHVEIAAWRARLNRDFVTACSALWGKLQAHGLGRMVLAELSATYHAWQYAELAEQVRQSVRQSVGNRWLFRCGSLSEYPLRLDRKLLKIDSSIGAYPILEENTPVRLDITHSGWSDIFFLAMERPDLARVINCSVDLAVGEAGQPPPEQAHSPICCYLRVISEPVLRLTSCDLHESHDYARLSEIFDFAADHLGLLKAAIVASGVVPPACDGTGQSLKQLLRVLVGEGLGLEVVSEVRGIPKGSRLAVSTNLLASLISLLMRATGQTDRLMEGLLEGERRVVASRAILGEWLGGSGGGWQDSAGIWPGLKAIEGAYATESDPEWQQSLGCLLPHHRPIRLSDVARRRIEQSLVVFHGGMSGNVGPILEQVTTQHLLAWKHAREARAQLVQTFDRIEEALVAGDARSLGLLTQSMFEGPLPAIIPAVGNAFTQACIEAAQATFGAAFWGFCMLGGMSGGGMAMWVDPNHRQRIEKEWPRILSELMEQYAHCMPFVITPVACRVAINESGTWAGIRQGEAALMPASYYQIHAPILARLRHQQLSALRRSDLLRHIACMSDKAMDQQRLLQALVANLMPETVNETTSGHANETELLLDEFGYDPVWQEHLVSQIRADKISMRSNRISAKSLVRDVSLGDVKQAPNARTHQQARECIEGGRVATLTLAGGLGSRWSGGGGVVKALSPFVHYDKAWRSFLELQLRKFFQRDQMQSRLSPHIVSSSFLTDGALCNALKQWQDRSEPWAKDCVISRGQNIFQRVIPSVPDLRYWLEELPRPRLDTQAERARADRDRAWMKWADEQGAGCPYPDVDPHQTLSPPGHWWEVPNLLLNGTLRQLLEVRPDLEYLFINNIDTLGAYPDAEHLARHLSAGSMISFEVIERLSGDTGGSLACVDGRLRLIEGLAIPDESLELGLSYYNSNTSWVGIRDLLGLFGLERADLSNETMVAEAVRKMAQQLPIYVTIKEVKRRWGRGQEDAFPVAQCEQLWGDMTGIPQVKTGFLKVDRMRGQQLKDLAQLPDWHLDGSRDYIGRLCGLVGSY